MFKRFFSLILIFAFCTIQCSMADTVIYGSASKVGKGKTLKAFLQNQVSTTDAVTGDPIVVILAETWVERGEVIAEAGSVINGVISSANAAGGWSKNGALQIDFKTMETPDGQIYGLNAEKIEIRVEKEKKEWVKKAVKAGGIILAVAAVGALFGVSNGSGSSTKSNTLTGTAIGAGIGAVAAITNVAVQKGDNITIPANTNFEIVLLDNITVQNY